MELSYLRYELADGYIHNWLVAGPQRIPVPDSDSDDAGGRKGLASTTPDVTETGLSEAPAEWSRFLVHRVKIGDFEGTWSYLRTEEDHFVDLSEVSPTRQLLRAWAFTQVEIPTAQDVVLSLTTFGPADVWLNDRRVLHHDVTQPQAETLSFAVSLDAGRNSILIRFERVGDGACTLAVALRMASTRPRGASTAPRGAGIVIPTTITPLKRRRELERTFDAAHLTQTVYERYDRISVEFGPVIGRWARGFALGLQAPGGRTFAEAEIGARPEKAEEATLGQAFSYPEGFYNAVLTPTGEEYAEEFMWLMRALPFWGLDNNKYSDAAYGELVERRSEALKQAARYPDDVWAEMAKMAVSWWTVVEQPVILRAIERVSANKTGSVRELLALLGIQARFSADPSFPEAVRAPLEDAVLSYRYEHLQPASASDCLRGTESDELLLCVCEILAGQRYPDRGFTASGQTGTWHRERGERLAMGWLRQRAAGGFAAWSSGNTVAEVVAALIHLVELANGDEVFEMATALLDKTLYSLALNSLKGVFGSTHGAAEVPELLHGMLAPTSGISRLMWGMGAFNSQTIGYVSLACANDYGFPLLIQDIATDLIP
ncbi:MAG: hypothetical protein MUF84_20020 [Anaerolineae bacterium]|nr:hypothetical protein [Anaerolineae bacterium]